MTADPPPSPAPAPRPPFNELSVLFPLLTLYTAAYLGLMAAAFLLRGSFDLPPGMMAVYIALVGAYATDKEIRRWMGATEPPRKGSLFVYLWLLFFLGAYLLHAFRREFVLPDDLVPVVLQVLGIFFGSRASKAFYERRAVGEDAETRTRREAAVLEMIRARGQVGTGEVAAQLQVSSATARRLLAEMTARGIVLQKGEGKGTVYVLPS